LHFAPELRDSGRTGFCGNDRCGRPNHFALKAAIAGYTDNTGDEALNVTLSQRRADAVRDALIKFGAAPDMLVAKRHGSADPIASNDTPEGRKRNRRIKHHIVKTPT
jgi:outer membrane protein OmpA-like peptidoglycan-associated protein